MAWHAPLVYCSANLAECTRSGAADASSPACPPRAGRHRPSVVHRNRLCVSLSSLPRSPPLQSRRHPASQPSTLSHPLVVQPARVRAWRLTHGDATRLQWASHRGRSAQNKKKRPTDPVAYHTFDQTMAIMKQTDVACVSSLSAGRYSFVFFCFLFFFFFFLLGADESDGDWRCMAVVGVALLSCALLVWSNELTSL